MFCKNCGATLGDNEAFCKNCGAPVVSEAPVAEQPVVEEPVQQPMQQPVQQSVQQQVPPQQNYQQQAPKKNNTALIICLAIAAFMLVVFIVGAIVISSIVIEASEAVKDTKDEVTEVITPKDDSSSKTPSASKTSTKKANTYKVTYGGYTFRVPDDVVSFEEEGLLALTDEDETWVAMLQVEDASFAKVKANVNSLSDSYASEGFVVDSTDTKTIEDVEFVILNMEYTGTKMTFAICKASAGKVFFVVTYNIDNEYDEDTLKEIAKVVSTAELSDEDEDSKNIMPNINVNTDLVNQFVGEE